MENNKSYEIKKTGTEKTYGAATRCSKEGKGRYDLIPEDVLSECFKSYSNQSYSMFPEERAVECAINDDYVNAITYITQSKYHKCDEKSTWLMDFTKMVRDLAIHFQKGAEMYGERNCEKGIPLWSFRDSGIRHLIQYINGETDEPHHISAIWNFMMAEWTKIYYPERCDKAGLNDNDDKKVDDCDNSTTTETSTTYNGTPLSEFPSLVKQYEDDKEIFEECKNTFENYVVYHAEIPKSPWENIINNIKSSDDKEDYCGNTSSVDTLKWMHSLIVTSLLLFIPTGVKIVNDECEYMTTEISLPKHPFSKDSENDKCILLVVKSTMTNGEYSVCIWDRIKSESIDITLHHVDGTLSIDCRKHCVDENSNTILNWFYRNIINMEILNIEEYCE